LIIFENFKTFSCKTLVFLYDNLNTASVSRW